MRSIVLVLLIASCTPQAPTSLDAGVPTSSRARFGAQAPTDAGTFSRQPCPSTCVSPPSCYPDGKCVGDPSEP